MKTSFINTNQVEEWAKKMTIQQVRCPNCGAFAERHFLTVHQLTRTACPSCDYLLISCTRTGNVVESYAPGICARR